MRKPYRGPARKLVLAFDVDTTHASVSYSILEPGEPPIIHGITRFPGNEQIDKSNTIPSIVYYDKQGVPQAFGSEATQEHILESAVENGWIKVEWWILHVGPPVSAHVSRKDIPPLPPHKTAVQVFADFAKYLFRCAKSYIQETHAGGIWESIEDNIDFVFSYPNGWEGPQQTHLRWAVVLAGLVPDSPEGHARVWLVAKGEGNLHFYLDTERADDSLEENQGVVVVDAGGGVIEVRSYCVTSAPAVFEEIAPVEVYLQGAVFVTRRAREFIKAKLAYSRYGSEEDIAQMTDGFNNTTMPRFRESTEPAFIRFGSLRDRDPAFDIKCGQLKLEGTDIAAFFQPTVAAIISGIERQQAFACRPIDIIVFTGTFSSNEWLFSQLQEHARRLGIGLCRPHRYTGCAVSNGAVACYLDHRAFRVSQFTYGTRSAIEFNKNDNEHQFRAETVVPRPSGRMVIPNVFSVILKKGTTVYGDTEFRKEVIMEYVGTAPCETIAIEIICYRGSASSPRWMDSEPGMFSTLCTIYADMPQVRKLPLHQPGSAKPQPYRQQFSIVLIFGLKELKAQASWVENGEEKRGPATVVFDQIIEEL